MRTHTQLVDGDKVEVHVVEHDDDLDGFRDFVRANLRGLAVDTEGTGLNLYAENFRLRMIQFGSHHQAWVLPVERGGRVVDDARRALTGVTRLVLHNAGFDLQVIERRLNLAMDQLWPKVLDTRILAHLADPRGREEGGIGHGLDALTAHHIDPTVADEVKGLMTRLAREHKTTKNKIWSLIALDHPDYTLYAGMDAILTARLASTLGLLVPAGARGLIGYEHQIAQVCAEMERTGFLLDVDYALQLSATLSGEEQACDEIAAKFGCDNMRSTEQVADVLEARGIRIDGRTPTGRRKVDDTLLGRLAEGGDEFAAAVRDGKRARKWRTTWVDRFLGEMDVNQRCHPSINALRARTARMSITGIPAQTLPSGDWLIRRCFIADDGHAIVACDYQTQELRVLAALSGDQRMQAAFRQGADLHQMTANAAGVDRKVGKTTNFAYVYGSGPRNIAAQCGIPVNTAKDVIAGFERSYPRVKTLATKLQRQARQDGYITTPVGRRLPVDPNRAYSALNYLVQSTSRDVTCRGLLRLHHAGYGPYLRLPIHDEVVASVPEHHAQRGAHDIARLMAEDFRGVHIGTAADVYGPSWGHGYMTDTEKEEHQRPLRAA